MRGNELVSFLRANLATRSVMELRQQLQQTGISDVEFDAALAEVEHDPAGRQVQQAEAGRGPLMRGIVWALTLGVLTGGGYVVRQVMRELPGSLKPPSADAPQNKAAVAAVAAATLPSEPASPAPPARPTSWTVTGKVYELMSLKPAAGVQVVFVESSSDKRFPVSTGVDGRYRLELPFLESSGYKVVVRGRGYRPGYLDEMEPPYFEQALERRQDARELFFNSNVLHVPLTPPEGGGTVEQNLVLVR